MLLDSTSSFHLTQFSEIWMKCDSDPESLILQITELHFFLERSSLIVRDQRGWTFLNGHIWIYPDMRYNFTLFNPLFAPSPTSDPFSLVHVVNIYDSCWALYCSETINRQISRYNFHDIIRSEIIYYVTRNTLNMMLGISYIPHRFDTSPLFQQHLEPLEPC